MTTFVITICAIVFFYKYGKREEKKIELLEQQNELLKKLLNK